MRLPLTLLVLAGSAHAQSQSLFAGDADDNDWFGYSVDVQGDRAVIGAPQDGENGLFEGAAYVFERVEGTWVQTAKLHPGYDGPGGGILAPRYFGWSVDLHGDRILVGAPGPFDDPSYRGEAYLFQYAGGSWHEVQRLASSDPADERFGESVAVSDEVLAVGTPFADLYGADSGAVYLYQHMSDEYQLVKTLISPDVTQKGDFFGYAVSLRGQEAVVGAYGADEPYPSSGAAFFYLDVLSADTPFKLLPPGPAGNAFFGRSISFDDEHIVVGEPNNFLGNRVHAFRREGPFAPHDQILTFTGTEVGDAFGQHVRLDDGRVLVTAPADDAAGPGTGTIYGYQDEDWADVRALSPTPEVYTYAGSSLAWDGETAMVGSFLSTRAKGVVWVYGADEIFQPYAEPHCYCEASPCQPDPEAGCVNSTGGGASLVAKNSASLARDDLVLISSGLPVGQLGQVILGNGTTDVMVADGRLCVGGDLYRFPVVGTGFGSFEFGPGMLAHADQFFHMPSPIQPGETWQFQTWYRDPESTCNGTSNLSHALAITFWP